LRRRTFRPIQYATPTIASAGMPIPATGPGCGDNGAGKSWLNQGHHAKLGGAGIFGTYNDRRADQPDAVQYGLSEVQDDRAADLWWQLKSPVLSLDGDRPILPGRSEPNMF
jgi:hypothetical protein